MDTVALVAVNDELAITEFGVPLYLAVWITSPGFLMPGPNV
jgi:hypothetical protein